MRPFPWGPDTPPRIFWVTHPNGTARFTQHPGFYSVMLGYELTEMLPPNPLPQVESWADSDLADERPT